MNIWKQLRYLLILAAFLMPGLVGSAQAAPQSFTTGNWQQSTLQHLINVHFVKVEKLHDARLMPPPLSNFQTNDPHFTCLNGKTLNAWVAPKEFPNDIVIYNGNQGQCARGTWVFPMANPTYTCTWNGQSTTLASLPYANVPALPDARQAGTCYNFQTNDPLHSCLNGQNPTVYIAAKEYPNESIVYSPPPPPPCIGAVWVFSGPPFYTFTGER